MYTPGCLYICLTFKFRGQIINGKTVKYKSGALYLLWEHFLLKKLIKKKITSLVHALTHDW